MRCPRGITIRGLLAALLLAAWVAPSVAVTHFRRGDSAPPIALDDLDGTAIDTRELADRVVVVVFGELYHQRTLRACGEIDAALADPRLAGHPVTPLLIVAQDETDEALRERAREAGVTWTILHDEGRRVFGTYRVTVMPSAVVIDGQGRVVHAMAGYLDRFADIVTDAILVGTGQLSPEAFDRTLHPAEDAAAGESAARAARLTSLARQLTRRGLEEMAAEKYAEALAIAPTYAPARLGLGMLHLREGRLAEAEALLRQVLAREPASVEALLGLAYLQTLRGGEELDEAESVVRGVLAANPTEPRAFYLLGLVLEQRNETEDALASYRRAAELLMSRRGDWDLLSKEDADERDE